MQPIFETWWKVEPEWIKEVENATFKPKSVSSTLGRHVHSRLVGIDCSERYIFIVSGISPRAAAVPDWEGGKVSHRLGTSWAKPS